MDGVLNINNYMPSYIERKPEPCPHCGHTSSTRTNRYLFRCGNYECGRYW